MIRAANDPSVFKITEKAPTRAFSWLKVPTSAFTFKTLLSCGTDGSFYSTSLDTSTVPRPPACRPVQYEAVVGGVPARAGGQVPGVQQQALPVPGQSSSSPVSHGHSVHDRLGRAWVDILPKNPNFSSFLR